MDEILRHVTQSLTKRYVCGFYGVLFFSRTLKALVIEVFYHIEFAFELGYDGFYPEPKLAKILGFT